MKCLHICCNFSTSALYKNLFEHLDQLGIVQFVFNPIRSRVYLDKNAFNFNEPESLLQYRLILGLYDRVNYKSKIRKLTKDAEKIVSIKHLDVIHAHTWFSDGGVAYELFKKYNVPYIVTIRNTDLNVFFKYMIHLRQYGMEILLNSEKIVFISNVYFDRFFQIPTLQGIQEEIRSKVSIIPNGIDNFWHNHIIAKKTKLGDVTNLLYVGNFSANKNVPRLINAVKVLNQTGNFRLRIVGENGRDYKKVLKSIKNYPQITYLGPLRHKELLKVFRDSDIFTMPSHTETFGLVYLEALSQGTPIIYTRNEGVDGTVTEKMGEKVDSRNTQDIVNKISRIQSEYERYDFDFISFSDEFKWDRISKRYSSIYTQIKH